MGVVGDPRVLLYHARQFSADEAATLGDELRHGTLKDSLLIGGGSDQRVAPEGEVNPLRVFGKVNQPQRAAPLAEFQNFPQVVQEVEQGHPPPRGTYLGSVISHAHPAEEVIPAEVSPGHLCQIGTRVLPALRLVEAIRGKPDANASHGTGNAFRT